MKRNEGKIERINTNSLENEQIKRRDLSLKSSVIKVSNKHLSISPKRCPLKRSSLKKNENNNSHFKQPFSKKHISSKIINTYESGFLKGVKNTINININKKNRGKRKSVEFMKTKTKNFFRKFSLVDIDKIKQPDNNSNNINNNGQNYDFSFDSPYNQLDQNLKNVLNNMRIEIEKEKDLNESHLHEHDMPKPTKNSTCPNLKFVLIKKKKNDHKCRSIIIKNKLTLESNNSLYDSKDIKRSLTFDFPEHRRKKLFKKIKLQYKKIKCETILTKNNETTSSDEELNNDDYKGFSFHPKSNYVFIFEIIIIIAILYSFIFIPIKIANNEEIGRDIICNIVLIYINDIIYIVDFILSFFRGYYNHDMQIIRNNKKILINYLKQDFFMDLIEAIPLTLLISKGIFKIEDNFGSSNYKIIFKLISFIKPFKILKIINKKNNVALEEFFGKFSESYRLEELAIFISSFLIFFLFVHLFICLHIFLSLQSYPNWITHINIDNKSFFKKYITSFYFLVTTMTTVGYGDIVCVSFVERIFHIILLAIGTIIYTFIISKVGNILGDESREQIKLSHDLNILENIRISYPDMSFKLYLKIKSHLLNISNKRKKTGISILINGIPDTIKMELLFKIYAKIIKEFPIFKNVKNSNFIIQVLTSFIPITLKKEEILLIEGEIVENIIFVKDGRLSMEMSIDLKDPIKAIQHYIELHFIDISRKDLKALNNVKSVNTLMNRNILNFQDLKSKIDNFLDHHKILNDGVSLIDLNNISADLGRLDFSRKESDINIYDDYETIKIFDIRKNDNFGEVNMFLDKPSPFTLKAKTRIVEVFLLRKQEALIISNNFPNIWRKIHNKSYYNYYSLKKLTIKTLKQYYNSHFYQRKANGKPLFFNFDNTASIVSFADRTSILKKLNKNEKMNLIKPIRMNNRIRAIKSTQLSKKNVLFDQNLFHKRKSSVKTGSYIFGIQNEHSPNNTNISSFCNTQSNFKPPINISSESIQNKKSNSEKKKKLKKKETFEEKKEKKKNNSNNNSHKKSNTTKKNTDNKKSKFSQNHNSSMDNYNEIIKNFCNSKTESKGSETVVNNKNNISKDDNYKNIINHIPNEKEKIFTLKDVDENFSKKIRKKIKKRKKIEKLKNYLELKRKEKNKNLITIYSNIISKKLSLVSQKVLDDDTSKYLKDNLAEELINTTLSEYNNETFSELLENTSSEEESPKKFSIYSLKKISTISFEIKSSYKNVNMLSKGDKLMNKKYKKLLESLIEENSNKQFFNDAEFKKEISKNIIKAIKKKDIHFRRHSANKYNKINKKIEDKRNSATDKKKFKSALLNNINNSSKNIVINISSKNLKNDFDIINKMIYNSSNVMNNKLDNSNEINDFTKQNLKYRSNENNNILKFKNDFPKYLNKIKDDKKKIFQPQRIESNKNNNYINSINNINNTTLKNDKSSSSLNYFNEIDKDNMSKSENKLKILNNKSITLNSIKDLNTDDDNNKKKCTVF